MVTVLLFLYAELTGNIFTSIRLEVHAKVMHIKHQCSCFFIETMVIIMYNQKR
jgi:hypothetical protein